MKASGRKSKKQSSTATTTLGPALGRGVVAVCLSRRRSVSRMPPSTHRLRSLAGQVGGCVARPSTDASPVAADSVGAAEDALADVDTHAIVERYKRDGYVVVKAFLHGPLLQQYRSELDRCDLWAPCRPPCCRLLCLILSLDSLQVRHRDHPHEEHRAGEARQSSAFHVPAVELC